MSNFVEVNRDRQEGGFFDYAAENFDPSLTWADVEWLASISSCSDRGEGCAAPRRRPSGRRTPGSGAIIVSNHGGRQLDTAVSAIDALPGVVEAVDGRCEVFVDGGVRRGTDVVKALASELGPFWWDAPSCGAWRSTARPEWRTCWGCSGRSRPTPSPCVVPPRCTVSRTVSWCRRKTADTGASAVSTRGLPRGVMAEREGFEPSRRL